MTILRVAFAGTPDFARSALSALLDSRHEVVGVLTRIDKPRGRGQRLAASPVKVLASERGLPVSQPSSLRTDADRAALASWHPDVLVVVAYGLLLPTPVLELPRLGCLNIHASLLPRWRGAAPIQRALLAGDEQTGISIMRLDAGLDTGPLLRQHPVTISATETSASLHDRLASLGASALIETLEELAERRAHAVPQAQAGVTYAAKISKAEARIDWTQSAASIDRQIRAFNPWPIAETSLHSEQLRILAARPLAPPAPGSTRTTEGGSAPLNAPGTVLGAGDEGVVVACGEGLLALTQVQRPGRRPVSARDLANTLPLTGERLG